MSARTPEELIRELAQGLAPLRPIPPLGAVAAVAIALWLLAFTAAWALGGPGLRSGSDPVWWSPSYLAGLAGLALLAACATSGALAAAVPGREASARLGAGAASLGLALAIAGSAWGVTRGSLGAPGGGVGPWLFCVGRAFLLGLAPSLLAGAFLVWTSVVRPATASALALSGGIAMGAVAVHLTCPSASASHWLVAHTLAPVLLAAVLALPFARWLRRWASRPLPASPTR